MNALRRFERWIAATLEDSLAALFGGKMQPADLARRLAAEMADGRRPGAGRIYVPNRFVVHVSPQAGEELGAFGDRTESELAAFVAARAAEEGDAFVGRVVVRIVTDPSLRRHRMAIEAGFSDVPADRAAGSARTAPSIGAADQALLLLPGQNTLPLQAAPFDALPHRLAILIGDRRMMVAEGPPVHFGRALENELVLDHPSVSRRHARLAAKGHHWEIEDLGSAAGVLLNGRRIRRAMVRPGDTLSFGRIHVRLERDA